MVVWLLMAYICCSCLLSWLCLRFGVVLLSRGCWAACCRDACRFNFLWAMHVYFGMVVGFRSGGCFRGVWLGFSSFWLMFNVFSLVGAVCVLLCLWF